jgi:hypothetical protein
VVHVDSRAAMDSLYALKLPVGWASVIDAGGGSISSMIGRHAARSIFGWLLTAFAISLGAPFWFDLLNRFMIVRSTVKPHEKSPEEGSVDRGAASSSDAGTGASGAMARGATPLVVVNAAANGANAAKAAAPPEQLPHEWAVGNPQGGLL